MAEVPHAHASRLQALLAWLVRCQSGAALPFLLPGLMLCSQAGNEDLDLGQPASHKRWHETLLQSEASCFRHYHSCFVNEHFITAALWAGGTGQHSAATTDLVSNLPGKCDIFETCHFDPFC